VTHPYNKHYFHGGTQVGGYAGSGYRDFPQHWTTYAYVMTRDPKSVLELGAARGYLLKRFADYVGLPVVGLEISEHCRLTRAVENIITHDVTKTPWPIGDQTFDICLSVAFLEHLPEEQLFAVFREMTRTTRRGLHGIDIHEGDSFDKTHHTIRPLAWWKERLPPGHEAVDKNDLEAGPLALPPGIDQGVKLNLGCFSHMFHGWRNLDRLDLSAWARVNGYAFTQWDLTNALPYDDQVVDLIFMSHVLEHFDYTVGKRLLRDCRRVLKPNGVLRVAVPDADKLLTMYRTDQLSTLREICGNDECEGKPLQLLHELLYGDDHRSIYDQYTLVRALHNTGFTRVNRLQFGTSLSAVMKRETIDLYPELSLFVEASP
jgi:SAM-dependent methyltransferase